MAKTKKMRAGYIPADVPNFDEASRISEAGSMAKAYRSNGMKSCDDGSCGDALNDKGLYSAYCQDRIAQRIINQPVDNAIGEWRSIKGEYAEIDKSIGLRELVIDAVKKARLYDSCAVIPFFKDEDGNIPKPSQETPEDVALEFSHFLLWTGAIEAGEVEEKVTSIDYLRPKYYKINNLKIHPSRIVFFGEDGCGFMSSIREYLAAYHEARERKRLAVSRNQAMWLSVEWDTFAAQMSEQCDGRPTFGNLAEEYLTTVHNNLNSKSMALIRSQDKIGVFEKSNIGDLIESVEEEKRTLAGVAGMQYSMLFGRPQSGLGSNAEEAKTNYTATLKELRASIAEPVRRLDELIAKSLNISLPDWEWNELQIDDDESAKTSG